MLRRRSWLTTSVAAGLALAAASSVVRADDDARRSEIANKGRELFKNTKDHCKSFQDLVTFATIKVDGPGQLVEDLKFVLIGEDLRRRGTGKHYIGSTPGARGDTGFKSELKDNSPQVEHAWAAVYIGAKYPPGSPEIAALLTEVMGPLVDGGKLNAQDVLLWSLGGDLGQRISRFNYKEVPGVIRRTMCA